MFLQTFEFSKKNGVGSDAFPRRNRFTLVISGSTMTVTDVTVRVRITKNDDLLGCRLFLIFEKVLSL